MVNRAYLCIFLDYRSVHVMVHFGDLLRCDLRYVLNYLFSAIDDLHGEHAPSQVEYFFVGDFGFAFERIGFFAGLGDVGEVFPEVFAHL